MKVSNESTDRAVVAQIEGEWYEIPAGGSIDVRDPTIAANLTQHGATLAPGALAKAEEEWAARNRAQNAEWSSAPAAETPTPQQITADPSGTQGGNPPAPAPADPEGVLYDPAEHTADEVKAYLSGLYVEGADLEAVSAEVGRVKAAEITGKNRSSVAGWEYAPSSSS